MLSHTPDTTMKRLKGCIKRADKYAKKGCIDKSHPLYVKFSNAMWYFDGEISDYEYGQENPNCTREDVIKHGAEQTLQNMICLDWFAMKVDEHLKSNMIEGDETLAAMLFEWKSKMPFSTTKPKASKK